ncbi:tyrosine-type recombinase/integrase [Muribaculum intestinale]|uniref:tyrosine-type recombinase/integrase n=1 Tax=Muribaculum intestinale TaxID=1796646 RepID=UPI0025A96805|nr:phage integrase SAM-like domain-containing protein [Muribaculum intestinale]
MATLRPCVQKQRSDGYYPVYIRVIQNRKPGYIKTDKLVAPSSVTKTKEIRDNEVLRYCTQLISDYTRRLNLQDTSIWTVQEVVSFLQTKESDASFTDYAKLHINRMINSGHERNAKNYKMAVQSLERYLGTNQIMFSFLSSSVLQRWIKTLMTKARCKEMYPVCIRQIFKAAILELNDEEKGIIRIKFNPWLKVSIPKADKAEQKAISAEECREFFNRPLPKSKMLSPLPEFGRDVAKLVLCLGGINTVDLYNMKKVDYYNGILHYKRAKTRHSRSDEAYMEMRVEPFIQPIFDKYLAGEDDEYLFIFHQRYCDSDSFNANVNSGIKKICTDMGITDKDKKYSGYTFRHTWATIAQNDCDANLFEVAFGMNHSHGFRVTRGYVKLDYSPAWRLNAKVIEFVFFSDQKSKQGKAKDFEETEDKLFRISKKMMIYGRAYFKGKVIAELTDIGFGTVDSIIKALAAQFPDDIPEGCAVQFRITNCDSQKEVVYERTKGKGF